MALAFTLETTGVRIGPDDMEATARGDYRVPPPRFGFTTYIIPTT